MELGLFDGGEDAEHTGVGFVKISIIILYEAGLPFLCKTPSSLINSLVTWVV